MNTSQLECFVQVALNLSFRRAAEELHLSQPTVSRSIAALEAELGGSLFVRSTREVLLTSLGDQFLRDAQEILRLSYAAEERARRQACGDELVIAYSDSNELMRLAPVLDQMRREREGFHALLRQGPRDGNVAQLEREQVDVVMGFGSSGLTSARVGFRRLAVDTLCCVVRLDSPLAGCECVGPEDVEGLSQVVCIPPSMRRHGSASQADIPATAATLTTQCSTSSEAYCLVDSGFGYALVPALYTMPDPLHKVIPWKGNASASYGFYHRIGSREGAVPHFERVATEVFSHDGISRPLSGMWSTEPVPTVPRADG